MYYIALLEDLSVDLEWPQGRNDATRNEANDQVGRRPLWEKSVALGGMEYVLGNENREPLLHAPEVLPQR